MSKGLDCTLRHLFIYRRIPCICFVPALSCELRIQRGSKTRYLPLGSFHERKGDGEPPGTVPPFQTTGLPTDGHNSGISWFGESFPKFLPKKGTLAPEYTTPNFANSVWQGARRSKRPTKLPLRAPRHIWVWQTPPNTDMPRIQTRSSMSTALR